MDEPGLRDLIAKVKVGEMSRRAFVRRMVALGLTAPMASQMLNHCGVAQAQTKFVYKPTKRGGGGSLKQPPLCRRHQGSGRLAHFYKSLAAWDANGDLKPVPAAKM